MNKKMLKHKLSKAFEKHHMAKPEVIADAIADTAIKTLEDIGLLEGELFHMEVHGYTNFYMKKDGEYYGHEWNSKKKAFAWYKTVIDPQREKKMIPIKNFASLIGIMDMLNGKQPL